MLMNIFRKLKTLFGRGIERFSYKYPLDLNEGNFCFKREQRKRIGT